MVALSLSAQPQRAPRLRLLLEQEPAYRVFLRNLADLVFSRTPLPIAVTSTPATSWDDVFVPSSVPWRRFVESLLGHMIVVTALLILVPKWPSGPIERPRVFDKSYVSYYTPPKSFPALRSHPARPQANRQPVAAHRPTIRVAPEHARRPGENGGQSQALTLPPDLISSKPGRLKLPASHTSVPMMPLSATGNSHLTCRPARLGWLLRPPIQDCQQLAGRVRCKLPLLPRRPRLQEFPRGVGLRLPRPIRPLSDRRRVWLVRCAGSGTSTSVNRPW